MVKDGALITPQLTDSVLESITRDTIIKLAKDMGITVIERTIDRTELYTCDEAFLCGSAMEVTTVLSVDKCEISSKAMGSVTNSIYKKYIQTVTGVNMNFMEWVTPIY